MSIAGQVLQNMMGSTEGWLGIDDPFHGTQPPQQGVELTRVGEVGCGAQATEFSFLISLPEEGQHLALEEAAEYAHRQEEAWSAVDPAGMIEGESTSREPGNAGEDGGAGPGSKYGVQRVSRCVRAEIRQE